MVFVEADLDPKNGFDAGLFCREREFHRAMQIAGVREGDGGHAVLFGQLHNGRRGKRGIQKGVMAVNPQGNVIIADCGLRIAD